MDEKGDTVERERGSVMVEMALVLPFLVLLVVGGWVLGYLAYTKMSLAMAADRAARDLAAATELHGKLETGTALRYDAGFAESFGLPRWGLHALALKAPVVAAEARPNRISDHAVTVAVCYRVPFTVPFGVMEKPVRYHVDTSDLEEAALWVSEVLEAEELEQTVADYQETKGWLEEEASGWRQVWDQGKETWDQTQDLGAKAVWVGKLAEELFFGSPPDFGRYREGVAPEKMEETVADLCQIPGARGSIVMTSRATYLMQTVWRPNGGGNQ